MSIRYTDDWNVDFGQVSKVLSASIGIRDDWDEKKTREAFRNSSYAVYALDGDKIVGTVRALSDNKAWTLIVDAAVLLDYRKQGIGGRLIEQIKEHFRDHELFTYTYGQSIPFFESHGFKRSRNSFTYAGETGEAIDGRLLEKGFFLPVGYRFEREFDAPAGNFPKGKKSGLNRNSLRLGFSETTDRIDYDRLNELLTQAFGGRERDAVVTREAFENSPYVEFAFDGCKLIGCARAESDGISQGLILNVAIDPGYQGLHIGQEVVDRLAVQMEGQNLFLNTHPGGVGFYNRKGFRRNKTAMLYPAHPDMPAEVAAGFVLPKGYRFADEMD